MEIHPMGWAHLGDSGTRDLTRSQDSRVQPALKTSSENANCMTPLLLVGARMRIVVPELLAKTMTASICIRQKEIDERNEKVGTIMLSR
jgi:hypothetical protein